MYPTNASVENDVVDVMTDDQTNVTPLTTIEFSEAAQLPTRHGQFQVRAVRCIEGLDHVLLSKGEVTGQANVPVRVHSECMTGEALHSMRCDCEAQLSTALDYFEQHGVGLLIYLRQEGRGIGLFNKIHAYALQDGGLDTLEANAKLGFASDARSYEVAAAIIRRLSIRSIKLLTNSPHKIADLEKLDVNVAGRIPICIPSDEFNGRYLRTMKRKMAHLL